MTPPRKAATHKGKARKTAFWSTTEAAAQTGLTHAQIRNVLTGVNVAKVEGNKHFYRPDDVLAALEKRAAEKAEVEEGGRDYWEIEKLKAQVDKIRFDLETNRGLYVAKDEVFAGYMAVAMKCRQTMLEATEKLPPVLSGRNPTEIRAAMVEYFDDALESLRTHPYAETFNECQQAPNSRKKQKPKKPKRRARITKTKA